MRKFNVAVVGATGAVGEEFYELFRQYNFPINKLVPLASANSVGKYIECCGKSIEVVELTHEIFEQEEIEIAFFSAGGSISEKFALSAVEAGALVIDNTSHFRLDDDIPLVVPEVNPDDIRHWRDRGIIANPNCSTIQMVQALKALESVYDIVRVDVSTYQAVSGAGKAGMEELVTQMQDFFAFKLSQSEYKAFAHQIALNVIPQVDVAQDNGYTKEEMKMVNETRKILHKDIEVSATCVRVPVLRSHSEAITVTFLDGTDIDIDRVKKAFSEFENLVLEDNLKESIYPMPTTSTDTDYTYVGRVRKDLFRDNVLHFWNVADQVRVGAATNSVRIALKWIDMEDR
jgi:aspartate-semialdehyde dehydrogenase